MDAEIERLISAAWRKDRLYPIRSEKYYGFYAGRLPDGRQALVTCGYPKEVCAYLFTEDCEYQGVERRKPTLIADLDGPERDTHVRELHEYLAVEFGFVPDLIRVKRFCESEELVSIEPLPRYLDEPGGFDGTDEEYLKDLRQWVGEGAFVLNTWNDYWLNANGEVSAS